MLTSLTPLAGYCQPDGLLDVTDCYYGFPISLSQPHFLDGDVALRTNVTGLDPPQPTEPYQSEFIVEPVSVPAIRTLIGLQPLHNASDLRSALT